MAKSDVKLLGFRPPSPFIIRVQMALKIKSVEYELIEINPNEKSGILVKANPVHKKIPVLIHGDNPICESLIIVQYIDDVWTDINGPSILPSDPYDRAMARFWAAYINDKWIPLFNQLGEVIEEEDSRKGVLEQIFQGLEILEKAFVDCSKGKCFFGGENVGYLDIAFGSMLGWIKVVEILIGAKLFDEHKTPRLLGWADKLYSDSLVKDVIPETEKLLEVFKKMKAAKTAA